MIHEGCLRQIKINICMLLFLTFSLNGYAGDTMLPQAVNIKSSGIHWLALVRPFSGSRIAVRDDTSCINAD